MTMKIVVRVEQLGTFSNEDRQDIKASLAAIGVDLDKQMVGENPQRPLRDELQEIAYSHARSKPPTPLQRAKELEKARIAVEKALAVLRHAEAYDYPGNAAGNREQLFTLYDLMTKKAAELQERIAKLKAMGGSGNQNRRTVQRDYWRELARLWLGITKIHRYRRKHLRRFLFACSQPRPFKTAGLEQRIDDFVHDFLDKRTGGNEI
jgi:hypothetical protein